LVCACIVGGTVAWLMDSTQTVTNTFTIGNINIELTESKVGEGTANESGKYKMIPGSVIDKDPTITVKKDSEACWLFVKIDKSSNYATYLAEYAVATGWTPLEGVAGVYYREVAANAAQDQEFPVLANNQVTVLDSVTKQQMEAIKTSGMPTLTFTAYAIQKANTGTVTEAWAKIPKN
jgi:hypothetical protein